MSKTESVKRSFFERYILDFFMRSHFSPDGIWLLKPEATDVVTPVEKETVFNYIQSLKRKVYKVVPQYDITKHMKSEWLMSRLRKFAEKNYNNSDQVIGDTLYITLHNCNIESEERLNQILSALIMDGLIYKVMYYQGDLGGIVSLTVYKTKSSYIKKAMFKLILMLSMLLTMMFGPMFILSLPMSTQIAFMVSLFAIIIGSVAAMIVFGLHHEYKLVDLNMNQ